MNSLYGQISRAKEGILVSLLLLALLTLGFLSPGSLNWGIALVGFLPPVYFVVIALCVVGAMACTVVYDPAPAVEYLAGIAEHKRTAYLAALLALFILAAIVLRVRASILGDSYTLLQNFFEFHHGASILAPWHEPLSIYVLYYAAALLGPMQIPGIYLSFRITEALLGCGFMLILWRIVNDLFEKPAERFLALLFLLTVPAMEYFLGYIEVYAVSTFLLGCYVLCAIRVLRGSAPFVLLPPLYVLVTLSHYISGLLGISLLYVAYRVARERGFRPVLAGAGAAIALIVVVLAMARFEPTRLIDVSPISHILSLTWDITPINAYSQAYTIFSGYHFLDIGNYLLFMAPVPVLLLAWWMLRRQLHYPAGDPIVVLLGLAVSPFLLFMLVAKLEQGFASDWDVFGGYFFILQTLFAYYYFRHHQGGGMREFVLMTVVSGLLAAPWFLLNATRDPSIRRFQSLWDQRILSHLGQYTHTLRLGRFYEAEGDSTTPALLWKTFSGMYPDDPRGYENRISVLAAHAPDALAERDSTYAAWLAVDPMNPALRRSYTAFSVTAGNAMLSAGRSADAQRFYERALLIDSTNARAWNNLGTIVAQENDLAAARQMFQRAIACDPQYSDALYNLGSVTIDLGDLKGGTVYLREADSMGNASAAEYLQKLASPDRGKR